MYDPGYPIPEFTKTPSLPPVHLPHTTLADTYKSPSSRDDTSLSSSDEESDYGMCVTPDEPENQRVDHDSLANAYNYAFGTHAITLSSISEDDEWKDQDDHPKTAAYSPHYPSIPLSTLDAEAYTDPMLTYPITPIYPYQPNDPTIEFYEIRTDTFQALGYASANTTAVRQHGVPLTIPPVLHQLSTPLDHVPNLFHIPGMIQDRVITHSIFPYTDDNHPLRAWDNDPLDITDTTFRTWETEDEHRIGSELMLADLAMESETVSPEDWEGESESEERSDVRKRVYSSNMSFHPSLSTHTYPRNPSPIMLDLSVTQDNSVMYPMCSPGNLSTGLYYDQNINGELRDFLADDYTALDDEASLQADDNCTLPAPIDYHNPEDDPDITIRYNAWIPRIAYLRRIRLHIVNAIRFAALTMLRPEWRARIDELEDDIKHYFYHHCHLFRFLERSKPMLFQGYFHNCIHLDRSPGMPPLTIRAPLIPHNPLLSPEEDEFLAHVATIYELEGRGEIVNNIRYVRDGIMFMPQDASILFNHGYLDPISFFDSNGYKRAIPWNHLDL
jgi:hypothetical protein